MAEDDDLTSPEGIVFGDEVFPDVDVSFSLEYFWNYISAIERFLEQESVAVRNRFSRDDEIYLEALQDFFQIFFASHYSWQSIHSLKQN